MASTTRLLRQVLGSKGLSKSLNGSSTKITTSRNLIKLIQGNSTIKARTLSQLAPCLALQASSKFAIGPISIIDKFIGKHTALTVAVNESEVTSVDETDEDEEATLYILSEMFSMRTLWSGDG